MRNVRLGIVLVTVALVAGVASPNAEGAFATGSAPTVTSVSIPGGTTAGGDPVVIVGTGFDATATVAFGGAPATDVSVASATRLTVTSPPHSTGTVDIVVTTSAGSSAPVGADAYKYVTPPANITWTSPADRLANGPRSVSCASPSWCLSLDQWGNQYVFDGVSWSTAGDGPGFSSESPRALSCVTPTFCVAIQFGAAAVYNGSVWTPTSPPIDAEEISCPTVTFCMARGNNDAATFNGTSWGPALTTHIPLVGGFAGISCTDSSFCMLGGDDGSYSTYNGTSWSARRAPTILQGEVNDVSCVSSSFCIASVGNVLTVRWTGTGWVRAAGGAGYSVACPSTTFCATSEGQIYNGSSWAKPKIKPEVWQQVDCPDVTLCVLIDANVYAATYQNGAWSNPVPFAWGSGDPDYVACAKTTCAAVDSNGPDLLTLTGTDWSQPTPEFVDSLVTACAGTSTCIAAGTSSGVTNHTYFTINRGSGWSALHAMPVMDRLFAASCSSPTQCVVGDAVGQVSTWSGGTWTAPQSLSPGHFITSLSCPATTLCIATDDAGNAFTQTSGVWGGATPVPGAAALGIYNVTCGSTTQCKAIDGNGRLHTYANGTWSSGRNVTGEGLFAITCISTAFCVGISSAHAYVLTSGVWARVDSVPDLSGYMGSVACESTTLCAIAFENNNA